MVLIYLNDQPPSNVFISHGERTKPHFTSHLKLNSKHQPIHGINLSGSGWDLIKIRSVSEPTRGSHAFKHPNGTQVKQAEQNKAQAHERHTQRGREKTEEPNAKTNGTKRIKINQKYIIISILFIWKRFCFLFADTFCFYFYIYFCV